MNAEAAPLLDCPEFQRILFSGTPFRSPIYKHTYLLNHQKTHQTFIFTPLTLWDPFGAPLDPLDPLTSPLTPLNPVDHLYCLKIYQSSPLEGP